MLRICILLAALICSQLLPAQISAITQEGKKVILFDDFSWKYADGETTGKHWVKRIDIDSSKTVTVHFHFSNKPFSLNNGNLLLNFKLFAPNTSYDYYDQYNDLNSGKLRRINTGELSIKFEYYDQYSDSSSGKIKSITQGDEKITFKYYDFFENINAGKLKSMSTEAEKFEFEYYDRFYDMNSGKLKSISGKGSKLHFEYYDRFNNLNSGKLKRMEGNLPDIQINNSKSH